MAKYIIDTEAETCTPYNGGTSIGKRILELFRAYEGAVEYDGVVAEIQKWYYGRLVKASWCATSVSYFAQKCGLKLKAENVKILLNQCKSLSDTGTGKLYTKADIPSEVKAGDILFWLWSGSVMDATSSKHVGVAASDTSSAAIPCIGGNQNDSICTRTYSRDKLYAVYRV